MGPNSLTSTDYQHQLAVLEFEWKTKTNATVSEKEEFTRNKRRLKNRMSALKSRERKREKLNELENTIAQLTEEVQRLQAENMRLKRMRVTSDAESENSKANRSELFQEQPKPSGTNSITCAHNNGGSALGDAMDEFAFDVIDDLDSYFAFDAADVQNAADLHQSSY